MKIKYFICLLAFVVGFIQILQGDYKGSILTFVVFLLFLVSILRTNAKERENENNKDEEQEDEGEDDDDYL